MVKDKPYIIIHASWVSTSIDLLCTEICWNVLYLGNKGVDKCQWFRWSDEAQMWFRGLGLQPETWKVAESRARWATDGVWNPLRWLQVSELLDFCSDAVTPSTRQSTRKKSKERQKHGKFQRTVQRVMSVWIVYMLRWLLWLWQCVSGFMEVFWAF